MPNTTPLIVPMEVSALLVNGYTRLHTNFQRWKLQYNLMAQFQSAEPLPFSGYSQQFQSATSSNGIYLHWTLPAALRHGTMGEGASGPNFPKVPNRWLVMRCNRMPNGTSPDYGAWVIESDYADPNLGTSSFMVPNAQGQVLASYIGRKIDITTGSYVPGPSNPMYLTAFGPGEPTFAAYQPYCENVFSLHDPLWSGILDGERLSYLVLGWYTDAHEDLLADWHGMDFAAYMDALGWSTTEGGATAGISYYEGLVYGIQWSGNGNPTPGQPQWPLDKSRISIGIGNTSVDVLTAFAGKAIGNASPNLDAMLLEAFQYGLLDELNQPGGLSSLQQKIHEAWFQQYQGGYRWTLEPIPADSPEDIDAATPPNREDLQTAYAALLALNQQQAQYDAALRTLVSQQVALYEMYWKQGYAGQLGYPQATESYYQNQMNPSYHGGIMAQVVASITLVNSLAADLPMGTTADALAASLDSYLQRKGYTIPQGYVVKQFALPSFTQANDPMLMVTGLNAAGLQETLDVLPCRFTDQLVKVVFVDGMPYMVDSPSQQTGISFLNLPAITDPIVREFMLLDPYVAAPTVNDPSSTPNVPAFYSPTWAQPWHPLYMEWEVSYYPIDYATGTTDHWAFDGNDFVWDGVNVPNRNIPVNGRIFLSPQSTYNFKARLLQYLETHPNAPLQNIAEVIERVNAWDFLSQAMDGFSLALAARENAIAPLPSNTSVVALGQNLGQLIGTVPKNPPSTGLPAGQASNSYFQTLRSGQMELRKLYVIDRFGQSVQLVNEENAPILQPVLPPSMQPQTPVSAIQPYRFIDLQPRLLQAARLDFDLLTADGRPHWQAAAENPIVGWIIANHLNRSLAVYSPAGDALGELKWVISATDDGAVNWVPAPISTPAFTYDNLQTQYPSLYAVLNPLKNEDNDNFDAFVEMIDQGLWGINPMSGGGVQGLSVLCGRPLALVKAALKFTLDGLPWVDPSWYNTQAPLQSGVVDLPLRIRLGALHNSQDGLIGYYQGNDYTHINAVQRPLNVSLDPTATSYITPIGADGTNYIRQSMSSPPTQVTMLLDPRGAVHAFTGLLPVSQLKLPNDFIQPAMAKLQLYFKVGPLLSSVATTDDGGTASILMPLPKETTAEWQWLDGLTFDPSKVMSITDLDATAWFSNSKLVLRNGVLMLPKAFDETT